MSNSNNQSRIYFYTPSLTAKELLYYPIVAGYYICDKNYYVNRASYDSILILYVLDGSITLKQSDKIFKAEKGEILIVDCFTQHEYYAENYATTMWMHFDGVNSKKWFFDINSKKGQRVKVNTDCLDIIAKIIDGIKTYKDEYELSSLVYSLLCLISRQQTIELNEELIDFVRQSKNYINNNLSKDLNVEAVANHVHLSLSYFSKIFKEITRFSPYSYIVNQRIDLAKKLLIQTNKPISIIASEVGFNSESNFIYCFKQKMKISPLQFRKLKF